MEDVYEVLARGTTRRLSGRPWTSSEQGPDRGPPAPAEDQLMLRKMMTEELIVRGSQARLIAERDVPVGRRYESMSPAAARSPTGRICQQLEIGETAGPSWPRAGRRRPRVRGAVAPAGLSGPAGSTFRLRGEGQVWAAGLRGGPPPEGSERNWGRKILLGRKVGPLPCRIRAARA